MILQRSRDDLTRGGGTAVDQHHQGHASKDVRALGAQPLGILGVASTRSHDLGPRYEVAADGDRLIQQAAWVVAKIKNECLQFTTCLLPERLDGSF